MRLSGVQCMSKSGLRGVTLVEGGKRSDLNCDWCCLFCLFSPSECVQVWLPQPPASAASPAGRRRGRHLPPPSPQPHRRLARPAVPRGGLLTAPLLLPFTVPALDLLQEGSRAARAARPSAHHHARLLPPEPPRPHDAQLARGGGVAGLQALQVRQVLPHASHRLPQGVSGHHQWPCIAQLPRDALHPSGLPLQWGGRLCRRASAGALRVRGRPAGLGLHGATWHAPTIPILERARAARCPASRSSRTTYCSKARLNQRPPPPPSSPPHLPFKLLRCQI